MDTPQGENLNNVVDVETCNGERGTRDGLRKNAGISADDF